MMLGMKDNVETLDGWAFKEFSAGTAAQYRTKS